MNRSWKTVVAGSLYPIGKLLQTINDGPKWIFYVGQALEYIAVFGLGVVAKDFNKTGV